MAPTEERDFDSLKRSRTVQKAQLTKLYKELEQNMLSRENREIVSQLYLKLTEKFEKFRICHLHCLDVCTDPDISDTLENTFEDCDRNFHEFQDRFSQWKATLEKTPEDDRMSVLSSLSTSSRSKVKGARAKRLIAEHKLKAMQEKIELERAKREIELKQQLLESESELEQARLEEYVWSETCDVDCDVELLHTNHGNSVRSKTQQDFSSSKTQNDVNDRNESACRPEKTGSNVDEVSSRRVDTGSNVTSGSIDQAFKHLANALHEGFNLPKPELLRFNGSTLEYCKFVSNFETNIENRVNDDRLKLSYLIQHCDGEAKRAIEDCVLLEPSEGYRSARDILYSRYGRPHDIARSYVDLLVHGPILKASDTNSLSNLALEMRKCEITLSQLGYSSDIDNTDNLRRLVKRLPLHIRSKWVEIAHSITESGREPRFADLVKFVDQKARIASSMYGLDLARESSHGKNVEKVVKSTPNTITCRNDVTHFSINSERENSHNGRKCFCCNGMCLDLGVCEKFKRMAITERETFVRTSKLCFNCLKGNHYSNVCKKPTSCSVPECKAKHHFLLHKWVSRKVADQCAVKSSVNCAATKGSCVKNCLGIIPVTLFGEKGNCCKTYALLDDGADKTLCDERLLTTLDLTSRPVTFQMTTASSTGRTIEGSEVDLQMQPMSGGSTISLRKVWSVKSLPISVKSAAKNSDLQSLSYLSDIEMPEIDASSVMLLIGTDVPQAHIPLEVRSGRPDQPYAVRTQLGWAVRGPVPQASLSNKVNVNFQQSADMLLQNQLEKMWTTDFNDKVHSEEVSMSLDDKRALATMEKSLKYENGKYTLKLPWKDEMAKMPNDLTMAHARLQQLKRKLANDHELHKMYTSTVSDYIQKGYAKEVKNFENEIEKRIWYLPHHPVTNPNKPGKVRVVFDCAAKYKGVSLNSQLLQGPDFMNSLIGVIIRFRQEHIAVAADIEAMFHQVRVEDDDCDALRFLWWPEGDINQQPKCYQMRVHLFGATSSPSCTAYALRRTALDNEHMYEPEVVKTVKRNFYVDDCLKSLCSEKKAITLASNLQSLMKRGGFRLTKWLSNSRNVLDTIPESERAPSVMNLERGDNLPLDRALGVHWDIDRDEIRFKVKLSKKPLTRRGILSTVSSIFDPLGLISPVSLRAKALVQTLCREHLGWDDPISDKHAHEWQQWLNALPALENVSIRRCFKPQHFGPVKNAQLHIFCDGSELGYGACAYIRSTDENGNIACSLIAGKSRLAPMKQTSIPRLELSGAVVASRLYGIIRDELETNIDCVTFWTDSMIVLGYIKNETRRFKTFVGNRIGEIHEYTSPDQWRHVDTLNNPADIASRGIEAYDSESLRFWLSGPEFLFNDEQNWPTKNFLPDIKEDDIEVKKEVTVHVMSCEIHKVVNYFSNWTKLRKSIAWLIRFKAYCRKKYLKQVIECKTGQLTVYELLLATKEIVYLVQNTCFGNEMKALKNNTYVNRSSRIATLNPTLENGLICSDGRSVRQIKRQIILPNDHHVTKLIITDFHRNLGHVGTQQVLAAVREKYWIIKGHTTVKNVLSSCVTCKRVRGPLSSQQMAPLLDEQTTPEMPPFTFVGIDYFGPLTVKFGRARANRYGCIFTCLATRAVHFEIAHSLTTDSFISAFQRFESRRGRPQKVYSDNGTNLVGGEHELKKSIKEWNQSKISGLLAQNEIEWHFNPPHASHMGGAWERLIRSTRVILRSLVTEQLLNDEQLLTFMTEAEKILNDRPLTPVSSDPRNPLALTPNMLLLMKSNRCLPVGIFDKDDLYAKRWWKQIQYLSDIFWKRWLREYLPSLQRRQKWQHQVMNIKKDDVVLIASDNIPRGQWPLARVVEVHYGRDGLVRSCVLRTRSGQLVRPVTKLCLLESAV